MMMRMAVILFQGCTDVCVGGTAGEAVRIVGLWVFISTGGRWGAV